MSHCSLSFSIPAVFKQPRNKVYFIFKFSSLFEFHVTAIRRGGEASSLLVGSIPRYIQRGGRGETDRRGWWRVVILWEDGQDGRLRELRVVWWWKVNTGRQALRVKGGERWRIALSGGDEGI